LNADQPATSKDATRSIIDNAHEAFVSMAAGGFINGWNRQAEVTFGWSREEAVGRVLSDTILPSRYRESHLRGLARFLDTGESPMLDRRFEIEALHRDGYELPIELAISALKVGDAQTFHAFLHDISERRRDARLLATRQAIATVLAEAETVEDAMPRLLCTLCEGMGWEFGVLWTVGEGSVLRCGETWTASEVDLTGFADATRDSLFEPGAGLPGRVWASERPAFTPTTGDDPNLPRALSGAEAGLTAAVGLPLLAGGSVRGVIECFPGQRHRPAPEPMEMLETLVFQIERFLTVLSDRAQRVGHLQQLSLTDDLTSLPNRRAWNEGLRRELARAQRQQEPLCLALIDLDAFKAFNDAHGHPAGDALLCEAARTWKGLLRGADLLARYGGEEFGLAFSGSPIADVVTVIDRIRAATPGGLTSSAGLTAWRRGEPIEALVDRADRALYEAKRRGRNQTVTAP